MIKKLAVILILLIPIMNCMAQPDPDISLISIDRPLWILGLQDPSWILPDIKRDKKLAIFAFNKIVNISEKERSQKEDNIGRVTRAIPLFLTERLLLETNLKPTFYVASKKGIPILPTQRTPGSELAKSLLQLNLDYIITGTIEESDNMTIIIIYVFDVKSGKERVASLIKRTKIDISEVGAESATDFLEHSAMFMNYKKLNSDIHKFSRPSAKMTSYYLNGLGQLFMQILTANNIASKEQLWGENDMLDWYQTLAKQLPDNLCCKLLYFNGIVTSISYKGSAYKNHLEKFIKDIDIDNISDPIVRLTPILYFKLNDKINLAKSIGKLDKVESKDYKKWLNQFK